ncbi:MAG: DUF1957 domain-containing protein [Gemmatimonadetes bacterium]|nr:DUF1957 domain-containing protein [Gemmatimonadota bacterium]MBK6457364.1 DUF1957 domain-containing protein [Gemmatimonadota bacterium]MBK6842575.1 DUF1957 domain-containing protein [Gemmatimonadota bacterium]MBK9408645.1 DUF1957 domain-containing protein [Gemmatimonadota bacterium]
MPERQVDFVLLLHSHLPYVLHHGRWPHGSDWLCEAALETYLPLIETLRQLEAGEVAAPVTLGLTPVLANQLAHPTFAVEFEAFVAQRLAACDAAAAELAGTPDEALIPLTRFWSTRLTRMRALWDALGGDLLGEFRRLQAAERLELVTSAATHAFLPLLGRDESIALQLLLAKREHRRLFGRDAEGCWVPECGYRPRGRWSPRADAPGAGVRRGIEEHLADAGFRYFVVDAHTARAGAPLGVYGDRIGGEATHVAAPGRERGGRFPQSPYRAYRVSGARAPVEVAALVRDPRSSVRVWSRGDGYPGDGAYLEFHKIRWPGGLRFWRVTARDADLGDKAPYDPLAARLTARAHAHDFAELLGEIAGERSGSASLITAPFDTELFGHWWFEGPDFLADLYAALPGVPRLRAVTAGEHLARHATRVSTKLVRGSWGRDGDYSMWFNERVQAMWPVIWELEEAFWDVAPAALAHPQASAILAQAARSLLLLQSSDWPFIVTTGAVEDYALARFEGHARDARLLLAAVRGVLDGGEATAGRALADELRRRDDLFPDVLVAVAEALGGSAVAAAVG